jgi:hypothetical protein
MSATEIKGKRAATNALWEKHKCIIESLYLKDGMSLKETMEVMAVNHGFNMKFVICLREDFVVWSDLTFSFQQGTIRNNVQEVEF